MANFSDSGFYQFPVMQDDAIHWNGEAVAVVLAETPCDLRIVFHPGYRLYSRCWLTQSTNLLRWLSLQQCAQGLAANKSSRKQAEVSGLATTKGYEQTNGGRC